MTTKPAQTDTSKEAARGPERDDDPERFRERAGNLHKLVEKPE
jgi:hypothetical protein